MRLYQIMVDDEVVGTQWAESKFDALAQHVERTKRIMGISAVELIPYGEVMVWP